MSRALAISCLCLFVAGTLLAPQPPLGPRRLGRDQRHAFAAPRPKGRTRLDAIPPAAEDLSRVAGTLAPGSSSKGRGHARTLAKSPAIVQSPSTGRRTTAPTSPPRLAIHLRC